MSYASSAGSHRVTRLSSASRCPHAEQVLELGYQRLITIRSRPARSHLQASWRRNSPQPQSEMAFASLRLRTMFLTARSSITITSLSRTRRVLARCRKSRRASRTLRLARATFALALARLAEPRWQRRRAGRALKSSRPAARGTGFSPARRPGHPPEVLVTDTGPRDTGPRDLADRFQQRWLEHNPFAATMYGIPGYDHLLPDE